MSASLSDFMTLAELAAYLKVPKQTVYGWNTRGGGPKYFRVGKHARYLKSDVDSWLASNAVDSGGAA